MFILNLSSVILILLLLISNIYNRIFYFYLLKCIFYRISISKVLLNKNYMI